MSAGTSRSGVSADNVEEGSHTEAIVAQTQAAAAQHLPL